MHVRLLCVHVHVRLCTTLCRVVGPADGRPALPDAISELLQKAGMQAVVPPNVDSLCCGMVFSSRGACLISVWLCVCLFLCRCVSVSFATCICVSAAHLVYAIAGT